MSGQGLTSRISLEGCAGTVYSGHPSPSVLTDEQGTSRFPVIELRGRCHRDDFVGRGEQIDELQGLLERIAGPVVLCGPAGAGKRQLAVEYAWGHRADFDVVWTLRADGLAEPDGAAVLEQDLGALARALHLPESADPNLAVLTDAVRGWLQGNPGG